MAKTSDKYKHINDLVQKYQDGSGEHGLKLLYSFGYHENPDETSWLIGKYFKLFRYGGIKFRNKDTRRFIRLFMTDPVFKKEMTYGYQYSDTKKAARKIVQMINNRMDKLTDEEIVHDLSFIILHLADRYKKKGTRNNFLAYVSSCYHFYVFRYYKYLFQDLIYSYKIEPFDDYRDENNEINIDGFHEEDPYFEHELETLGFNWILGRTATYPFDQLTQFERTILNLYDNEGMTYAQVGEQTGYHKDTIYRKRKEIKLKLKKAMENPPE